LALEFEWNPRKAAANLAKHSLTFEEAASVFGGPSGRIIPDPRHSTGEERFVLLGRSCSQRLRDVHRTRFNNPDHQRTASYQA